MAGIVLAVTAHLMVLKAVLRVHMKTVQVMVTVLQVAG
jgi:hypothetical protein